MLHTGLNPCGLCFHRQGFPCFSPRSEYHGVADKHGQQRVERQCIFADEVRILSSWDIEAAEYQYLLRNISLVELIDRYSTYCEAQALLIDIEQGLIEAAVAYNLVACVEVVEIQ